MTDNLAVVLLIVFGTAGLNMILVRSDLFFNYRAWILNQFPSTPEHPLSIGYLANCPQCNGMWLGMLLAGGMLIGWDYLPYTLQCIAVIPLAGGAVSLIGYAADRNKPE